MIHRGTRKKAVVLLSGGIDSSTTLAVAKDEGYVLFALSFDYHQRHRRELDSARMMASACGVEKHLVMAFDFRDIGGSALTSEIAVPKRYEPETRGSGDTERKGPVSLIPTTYVPARNTVFLSFALAWAEVLEAADMFIGANAVDYSGYPDCRPEYLKAFETMANLATRASVEGGMKFTIRAPLLFLTKSEIIRRGVQLGVDYGLTWSCYDPQPDGKPCRRCDSCLFREKGFTESGLRDPLLE